MRIFWLVVLSEVLLLFISVIVIREQYFRRATPRSGFSAVQTVGIPIRGHPATTSRIQRSLLLSVEGNIWLL